MTSSLAIGTIDPQDEPSLEVVDIDQFTGESMSRSFRRELTLDDLEPRQFTVTVEIGSKLRRSVGAPIVSRTDRSEQGTIHATNCEYQQCGEYASSSVTCHARLTIP